MSTREEMMHGLVLTVYKTRYVREGSCSVLMRRYADQESKAFLDWIRKECLEPYAGEYWINRKKNMVFNTDQLYEQYTEYKLTLEDGR